MYNAIKSLSTHSFIYSTGIDDFVAVLFFDDWYLGKILSFNEDKTLAEIKCLQATLEENVFEYPRKKDVNWYGHKDIICDVVVDLIRPDNRVVVDPMESSKIDGFLSD
jgi:hypothetical protein